MLYVQTRDKIQRHILRSTLKEIKNQLGDERFVQIHRSFVVNRSKIINLSGNKSKSFLKIEGLDKLFSLVAMDLSWNKIGKI